LLYSLLPNRRILILHGFQQEEAAKSALWLQLVEARQRAGLSQAEVAKRKGSLKPKSPALRRLATMPIP
jgi:hypothetical protein